MEKSANLEVFSGGDRFFGQMKVAGIADDDFIKEIVETFLAESNDTLNELTAACEREDLKTLCLKAHKLKAGLAMFDLLEEHQLASKIEKTKSLVTKDHHQMVNQLVDLCKGKFELLNRKYILTPHS